MNCLHCGQPMGGGIWCCEAQREALTGVHREGYQSSHGWVDTKPAHKPTITDSLSVQPPHSKCSCTTCYVWRQSANGLAYIEARR